MDSIVDEVYAQPDGEKGKEIVSGKLTDNLRPDIHTTGEEGKEENKGGTVLTNMARI